MKTTDAEALARELFVEHNLNLVGWTFRFDRAKRRFGSCEHATKTITLSKALTELNDEGRVRLTLLHEIAHALVGADHGHDRAWRQMCKMIGGDGKRTYSTVDTNMPDITRRRTTRKMGVCPNCERRVYRKVVKNSLACGLCCRKHAGNKWDARFVYEWTAVGQ